MSARSKRRRHLKWLKKQEAERNPVVEVHVTPMAVHSEPRRILSNETFTARITWPDRSGNGHDLHAEPSTAPSIRGSVDNPAETIAEAVNIVAATNGEQTIWVAPGTYQSAINAGRVTEINPLVDINPAEYYDLSDSIILINKNRGELRVVDYIKMLVEADNERKKPAELVVPAIRHLDLED